MRVGVSPKPTAFAYLHSILDGIPGGAIGDAALKLRAGRHVRVATRVDGRQVPERRVVRAGLVAGDHVRVAVPGIVCHDGALRRSQNLNTQICVASRLYRFYFSNSRENTVLTPRTLADTAVGQQHEVQGSDVVTGQARHHCARQHERNQQPWEPAARQMHLVHAGGRNERRLRRPAHDGRRLGLLVAHRLQRPVRRLQRAREVSVQVHSIAAVSGVRLWADQ